jgi:hypothetical protein
MLERGPLRISGAASLGESLLHLGAPTQDVPREAILLLLTEIRLLRLEVTSLRADLRDRSLEARWARLWQRVRRFLRMG